VDNLTPFIKRFGIAILSAVAVLAAFFMFGVDQRCTIALRNAGQSPMVMKIYKYNSDHKRVVVDSVSLGYDESFDIGSCKSCSPPDTMSLAFDAVALYDSTMTLRFMRRQEFINYLESKERRGCVTYVVK